MKQFFTSYYAKSGNNPNAVAISAYPPSYYTGKVYKDVAPSMKIVNGYKHGNVTEDEYEEEYFKILKQRGITPQKVVDTLPDQTVLLCYEKSGDFCHRILLAHWIERNSGLIVPELFLTPKRTNETRYLEAHEHLLEF